jgi:hypothetical protein
MAGTARNEHGDAPVGGGRRGEAPPAESTPLVTPVPPTGWPRVLPPAPAAHAALLPGLPAEGVTASLRLTPRGIPSAGTAPPALAEVVAYTGQLVDLVGELIGAGPFGVVELTLSDGSCVMARAHNGDLLAARAGPSVEANALKRRLLAGDER